MVPHKVNARKFRPQRTVSFWRRPLRITVSPRNKSSSSILACERNVKNVKSQCVCCRPPRGTVCCLCMMRSNRVVDQDADHKTGNEHTWLRETTELSSVTASSTINRYLSIEPPTRNSKNELVPRIRTKKYPVTSTRHGATCPSSRRAAPQHRAVMMD